MESEEKSPKGMDLIDPKVNGTESTKTSVEPESSVETNEVIAVVHGTVFPAEPFENTQVSSKNTNDSGIFGIKNESDRGFGTVSDSECAPSENSMKEEEAFCEDVLISQGEQERDIQEAGEERDIQEATSSPSEDTNRASVPTDTKLYFDVKPTQWPIVYTSDYNIGFLGLERLHPFDAGKWGKVNQFLKDAGMTRDDTIVKPLEAQGKDLQVVHSKKYISSLRWSINVAQITEVPPVAFLPNFIVQRRVLKPFRFHVGGTVLAGKLAVERGWAVNIGGGFHHCSAEKGGGFCAYADITLTIKYLFDLMADKVKKAMIIDLDAHQGNGHERDFMDDPRVYILDVYNRGIYPHDGYAKRAINRKVELSDFTDDVVYLELVKKHVRKAFAEFTPDVVVYNAGTDILDGDPLGCLSISPEGIIERDQIVFQETRSRDIPIIMVTSGGYQKTTAKIIADSILNLRKENLIVCEDAEKLPKPRPKMMQQDQSKESSPAPVSESASMSRSRSDGSIWARFRDTCIGVTHSQTQTQLASHSPQ